MNGREIKTLRIRKGWTQKQLAESIGVTPNTVARWERNELGISEARTDRLLKIAESLPSGSAVTKKSGVVLDPLHRAILARLNKSLDPEVFEACAVALLQAVFPSLVAIRGGKDHGFDGAATDPDSTEPLSLIVTSGQSLERNLKTNIESAKRNNWNPKHVLFATSQRIEPAIRRKLFDAAEEREVTLLQTFDQDWFASRLYHEPQWRKRLLNLSGRPSALSLFPVSRRPILGDDLIGREREKEWLLEHDCDCVVVGEPGSGKTFLLRALALEGKARFLVDIDREQIADDLRSLEPEIVIVDDAHVEPTSIETLLQLRTEVNASFRIVATCWPGEVEKVRSKLQVRQSDVLKLDLIDADTMIEIVKSLGIHGSNELLREIRIQAAGRPGLATTLAHLCLIGDIRDAISGEGLVNSIASALDQVLRNEPMRLLAPFALGGDFGVRMEDVARQLNMSLLDVSSALATMSAAGIVRERCESYISVEPPPMRWALVRRAFFDGPGSLPVEDFLSVVPDREEALRTLIGTRSRGAAIPNLERMLEECNSERLWVEYAKLGPAASQFALSLYPERFKALVEPALEFLPDVAIPVLLSDAQEACKLGVNWESEMHPLERWIKAGSSQGKNEAIRRRTILVRCSKTWWHQSRNSIVSLTAMCIALKPDFDFATQDPGIGKSVTFSLATVNAEVFDRLTNSWSAIMTVVNEGVDIPWVKLIELVGHWCRARISSDAETQAAAVRFRSKLLNDLASASQQYPGVQHRISGLANSTAVELKVTLDTDFECLYPQKPIASKGLIQELKLLERGAFQLAERWRSRSSDDIARFLGRVESEAHRADITYPRFTPVFCRELAATHSDPATVANVFMRERLHADLVEPFLREALNEEESPAWSIVLDCLGEDLYVSLGSQLAICHESAPSEIVSLAIDRVHEVLPLLEMWCLRGEVPHTVLSKIFRSRQASTAVSAAVSHWQAHSDSESPFPLYEAWRDAILRSAEVSLYPNVNYVIGEILTADGGLAKEWLLRLLSSERNFLDFGTQEAIKEAVKSMDSNQRIGVLESIRPDKQVIEPSRLVPALVGFNVSVYRRLLRSERLKDHHLTPLKTNPDNNWRQLAVVALDHGYSCIDVAESPLRVERSWEGEESAMWRKERQRFEKLQDDDDSRIVEVGHIGMKIVAKLEKRAKDKERRESIYGIS